MKEEKFRCHPSIIVEKTGGVIAVLFFLDRIKEMVGEWLGGKSLLIVGFLTFILIYNIIIWFKTLISIEGNAIVIQRNTINSKVNTFGIKNISSINLEQNVFERIMGTYKIKIDTDSLSTADSTDIEIVLSKQQAYDFKNKVISIMNSEKLKNDTSSKQVENTVYFDEDNIGYDIVYSVSDVLKHCFCNISLLGLILNLALIGFIVFAFMNLGSEEDFIAVWALAISSLISILSLVVGDLFKYYNFSIKRQEDKLYMSYGLFRVKKFTVPINKINALNIKQSAISRIFKRYHSDIVTVGVGDNDTEGSQILLASKKEDFIRNMKILLPELNLEESLKLERESKNHYIIKIVNVVIGMTICSLILYSIYIINATVPSIIYLLVDLFIFLILILFYYMSYRTRGLYMGDDNMTVSWGILTRKISVIKYEKIQYVNVRETPISSRLGLCSGKIYILASLGNTRRTLGYYNNNLFEKLKGKILNRY